MQVDFSLFGRPLAAPVPFGIVVALLVLAGASLFLRSEKPYPDIPLIDVDEKSSRGFDEARKRYASNARELIQKGLAETKGHPFQLCTSTGFKVVVPRAYIDEIRNNPSLSFAAFLENHFFSLFKGFEAFRAAAMGDIFQDTIKTKLTSTLAHVTDDLCNETTYSVNTYLPPTDEWKEITFTPIALGIATRLGSRVFLGKELCRDPQWIRLSIAYTVDSVMAGRALRTWPPSLRYLVSNFLPECRKLREDVATAHRLIDAELNRRVRVRKEYAGLGKAPPEYSDSLQWMEDIAKGRPFDVVSGQLAFSFASVHTTSGLVTHTMYDLIAHPEYFDLLRDEIVEVLGPESSGWRKATLSKLKMMDSVLKESQRMHTSSLVSLTRKVTKPIRLSDGTVLPKGALTMTPSELERMNPELWTDPETFNGRRFFDLRKQPGNENKFQLVTLSSEHLGFGHGTHACPGRFFAANEVKIAMVYLIMKYDWKFRDSDGLPRKIRNNQEIFFDPTTKVMYRARQSEIDFPGEKV